jgi:hypothetical protein
MANYVKVDVVCPCGRLLTTKTSNADSGSISSGSMRCPSCKKNVSYQVRGANAYTSYKD